MLKDILSISGKPGLFKLISQGKGALVVESLLTGKKAPAFTHEKIISLGDIAIFTEEEEKPLFEVFCVLNEKEEGKIASISPKAKPDELKAYFAEVLPNFDRDRVYPNDIKKLISWYNILIEQGYSEKLVATPASTEE